MHTHGEQRDQHQHDRQALMNGMEHQPGRPENHDRNFRRLDDADQRGLVAAIRQLSGKRREKKKGQDEKPAGQRREVGLFRRIAVDLVDDQNDHRRLEQIIVEGTQELRDEQGQETPLPQ